MSNDPLPDSTRTWGEGDTPVLTVTLVDGNNVPIPLANILTFTLDEWISQPRGLPGISINSRKTQNVLNTNGVTVAATSGLVTWQLGTGDTAMQSKDTQVMEEKHDFRFIVSYNASGTTEWGSWVDYFFINRKTALK